MVKWLDKLGEWILEHLDARAQLRVGVLFTISSIPFYVYMPFSGEQVGIYLMSALALSGSGLGFIVGAEVLVKQEDQEKGE